MTPGFGTPPVEPAPPSHVATASHGPSPRSSRALGCVVALVALALGVLVGRIGRHTPPPAPTTTQVVRATPDVITAIRSLAKLESVSYHVERIVDVRDRQNVLFGAVDAEDALLLVAAGDVIAGVDLGKLAPGNVVVDPVRKRVRIVLPGPEIFSARLDSGHTYVYSRETDLLAKRSETLETRARADAERTMRDAALSSGILEKARTDARTSVAALVRALGFSAVEVRFADEER